MDEVQTAAEAAPVVMNWSYMFIVLIFSIGGLLFALWLKGWVMKQPTGSPRDE